MKALLFFNSRKKTIPPDRDYDLIAACNGGSLLAKKMGFIPDVIIGDRDSLPEKQRAYFSSSRFIVYPEEKDATDGELSLHYLAESGVTDLTVCGIDGGRLDRVLSNVFVCAELLGQMRIDFLLSDAAAFLLGGLRTSLDLTTEPGKDFSLIPLENTDLTYLRGTRYPLENSILIPGSSLTVSNKTLSQLQIKISRGKILLVMQK